MGQQDLGPHHHRIWPVCPSEPERMRGGRGSSPCIKVDSVNEMLVVNLTTEEMARTDLPEPLARRFLGGRGFNARLLARHVGPGTDPQGPGNVLALSCGLLTGTQAPASSRLHVSARSPLTGLLGSSNVGGHFGAELRAAGVQTLLVKGSTATGPSCATRPTCGASTRRRRQSRSGRRWARRPS
jgi:hypothetical protein